MTAWTSDITKARRFLTKGAAHQYSAGGSELPCHLHDGEQWGVYDTKKRKFIKETLT